MAKRSEPLTPEQRVLRARMAAYARIAKYGPDETVRKAHEANATRFERQVGPNNELAPEERARRAEAARKSYMTGLALKRSQVAADKRRSNAG